MHLESLTRYTFLGHNILKENLRCWKCGPYTHFRPHVSALYEVAFQIHLLQINAGLLHLETLKFGNTCEKKLLFIKKHSLIGEIWTSHIFRMVPLTLSNLAKKKKKCNFWWSKRINVFSNHFYVFTLKISLQPFLTLFRHSGTFTGIIHKQQLIWLKRTDWFENIVYKNVQSCSTLTKINWKFNVNA